MSIYTRNRLSESKFGTGLPFYLNRENQERFKAELYVYGSVGHWVCPSNELPTWQIRTPTTLTTVELIPTDGKTDGTPIVLPLSAVEVRAATDNGTGFDIAFTTPTPRAFSLCGTHYFRLTFDNGDVWYSEVFVAGLVCGANIQLTSEVLQVNVDDTVNVRFVFSADAQNISAANVNILAVDYPVGTFIVNNIPLGATPISINVETAQCGTFADAYIFTNSGGGITTLVKQYT